MRGARRRARALYIAPEQLEGASDLDHRACPLLAPLAGDPRFLDARRRVTDRAAQVLAAYRSADLG